MEDGKPQYSIVDPSRLYSITNPHRIDDILHGANNRQRRQSSSPRIFARHVFDMHVQLAELAFDIDVVAIARQPRHGENSHPS